MSAVALERQFWWRPNLQQSHPHHPPPLRVLNHPAFPGPSRPALVADSQSGVYLGGPGVSPAVVPDPLSFAQRAPRSCSASLSTLAVAASEGHKMHAPATTGSLAVSTIQHISASDRSQCEVMCRAPSPAAPATAPPRIPQDRPQHTSTSSSQPRRSSSGSQDLLRQNPGGSCWPPKNLKGANSRSSLSSKNGGCYPRRRITDDEGYIRRAACICVNKEETQVLLVSSKKDPCVWLVPGGGLEAGEDPVTAARREAWEEAGIHGHIARYLGLFESCHHSGLKKHRTAVYIFVVTEEHSDFPEARLGRRRQWYSMEEALLHLARNRPLQSAYMQLYMMSKLKVAAAS